MSFQSVHSHVQLDPRSKDRRKVFGQATLTKKKEMGKLHVNKVKSHCVIKSDRMTFNAGNKLPTGEIRMFTEIFPFFFFCQSTAAVCEVLAVDLCY